MNNRFKLVCHFSIFLGIAAAIPIAAKAQTHKSEKAGGQILEEVIVTATRREERLQDVPISISVFNQQQLNEHNIVNPSDLATYTPSLSADTRFGDDNAAFSIRGFTQEVRTTPSVGVYFSDVVEPRGGGHGTTAGNGAAPGDLFDLQNVQVLKGPQGTLFGRNTTGGAILIVPRKPTSEFGGYLQGSVGNYNMHRVQGVVNVPLTDNIRMRAGLDHQTRNGYLKNISGIGPHHFADEDYIAARLSLVIDITPDLENYTIARWSKSDHNGTLQQLFACNTSNPRAFVGYLGWCTPQLARLKGHDFWTVDNKMGNPKSLVEQWQVINKTTWQASDNLTVKNIVSYGRFKSIYRSSIFGDRFITPNALLGGLLPTGSLAGLPLAFTLSNPPPGHWTNAQSTTTEELQFQGHAFDEKLRWTTGLYVEASDPLEDTGSLSSGFSYCSNLDKLRCVDVLGALLTPLAPPGMAPLGGASTSFGKTQFRDYAVYGQATYNLTDQLALTVGARYTYDRTKGSARNIVYNFYTPNVPTPSCPSGYTTTYPDCSTSIKQTSHAPTWVVNLQYTPFENAMFYGKYARGYRQGSVSPDSPPGLKSYDPEKVDTYEIGAKTKWQDVIPGAFNIAAFYNDFTNQQLQVGFQGLGSNLAIAPTTATVNAGKSRIYGMEIDTSIQPVEGFSLGVSWSYLNTKLKSQTPPAIGAAYGLLFTSKVGGPLPFTPKNKVVLTASYTLPMPASYGRVTLSTGYVYTAKELTAANSPYGEVGPSKLINANINWKSIMGSQFDLSVFGTNLWNDKYVTYVPGLYNGFGFETRSLGEPRMYGMRLRYNFGS